MKPAQILISYAEQRKRDYSSYGLFEGAKLKSYTKIKQVSEFFIASEKKGWIYQLEKEIRELLPPEDNAKKGKLREKILDLLNN